MNNIFLNEIFKNHKEFKKDFIKIIYRDVKKIINDAIKNTNDKFKIKIRPSQVKFILKGGMNFYSLYYTFLNKIDQVYPKLKKLSKRKIEKNKRSDYDFTILIDPRLDDNIFYFIYKEINMNISKNVFFIKKF